MSQETVKNFLSLVCLGIGKHAEVIPNIADWSKIETIAIRHGLSAVLVDGVELLPNYCRPPQRLLLQWIGVTLQGYEYYYEQYCKAISELAGFYNSHGFKMMILKGYACSLDWPKPEHRPCGDIDIWLFGQQKDADASLVKEKGVVIDNSHQHHTVFNWKGFTVENHFDFINTHRHYSHNGLEKLFKELGQDDSYSIELNGQKVYIPSPNLHALFLIRHALNHFSSIGINLRQVLDWAFFVEKHTDEIDWQWLTGILEDYHMTDFFNCINAICVENLCLEASIFHGVQFNPNLKEKVLADILTPEYEVEAGFKNKFKRWKGNRWKHQLCFKESMWTSFWHAVWGHLQKPKTI